MEETKEEFETSRQLRYYYKNRDKRIKYQKKWDKENRDKKRKSDDKRYCTKQYNKKQLARNYSRKNHLPILLKKFKSCQLCKSSKRLQIHHKKYNKEIKDCLLLCEKCHKIMHRKTL